jgi:hypothetical protein
MFSLMDRNYQMPSLETPLNRRDSQSVDSSEKIDRGRNQTSSNRKHNISEGPSEPKRKEIDRSNDRIEITDRSGRSGETSRKKKEPVKPSCDKPPSNSQLLKSGKAEDATKKGKEKVGSTAKRKIMPDYQSKSLSELNTLGAKYGMKPASKEFLVQKLIEIWKVVNGQQESESEPERPIDYNVELSEYIKKNQGLYKRILCYEPLDIDEVHSMLVKEQRLGKLSRKVLVEFFNSRSINHITK